MPPYTFQLETVRRVRQIRRDELRGELADAFRAAEVLASEQTRIESELAALRNEMQHAASKSQFDVNRLLDMQRYELVLKGQLQGVQEKAVLVEKEIGRRRATVVAAEQSVRALDTLDSKGKEQHRQAEARAENKQMDDIAGVLWARQQRSKGHESCER